MRKSRVPACLLLCAVAVLLTISQAEAQSGFPEVPIGPKPGCVAPAPVEPPASPVLFMPWSGPALLPLVHRLWLDLSVAPLKSRSHPVALRERRGWTLPASMATAGRLIK